MKLLVTCRPRHGVDPARDIVPRAQEEMAALRELRDGGPLLEAYSPGGPGAVLIFGGQRDAVERALQMLPLLRDGIIGAEITELHPFAALD